MSSMFGSVSMTFSQITSCFLPVAAALVGAYLFVEKTSWCNSTVGKMFGGTGKCDTARKAAFAAVAGILVLVLINMFSGGLGMGGYGGGYSGGYAGGYAGGMI